MCIRPCRFVARPVAFLLLLQGTKTRLPGGTMTEDWHLFWHRACMSVPWLTSYRGRTQPGQVQDAGRRDPRRLRMAVSEGIGASTQYITGHRSVLLVFAMSHNLFSLSVPLSSLSMRGGPKHHLPRLPQQRRSVLSGPTQPQTNCPVEADP